MTTFVFSNFFQTTIAAAATSTATSISVASDANVPTIAAGQQWAIVVQSANTPSIREVMYVTATSGTTFTVSRGQEGTAAQAWSVGDNVLAGNTAGQMGALGQLAQTQTWTGADTFTQPITALGPLLPNGFANMQIFTASGTFTVPSGVTKVRVRMWGGGGGGGGSGTTGGGGGSGGGGAYGEGIYTVAPGQNISVTVGAAGAGGFSGSSGTAGSAGGTSSFGSLLTCTGGAGGGFANNSVWGATAPGGTASGGNILNVAGQASGIGISALTNGVIMSGAPGGSLGGAGSPIAASVSQAGAGMPFYGCGATGGLNGANGGTGSGGVVIVEW